MYCIYMAYQVIYICTSKDVSHIAWACLNTCYVYSKPQHVRQAIEGADSFVRSPTGPAQRRR